MQRYLIEITYNGSKYFGWQIQPNQKTIQGELMEKITLLLSEKINLVGCGRTDTGVHAIQFFAHFDSKKKINTTISFVDIAGLVKGASKGEGLGNAFLANIREMNALLHVVRCFNDENITHVNSSIDPINDIDTVETELKLSELGKLS